MAVLLFLLRLATGLFLVFNGLLAMTGPEAVAGQALMRLHAVTPGEISGGGAVALVLGLVMVLGVARLPVYGLAVLLLLPCAVLAGLAVQNVWDGWISALVALPMAATAVLAAMRDEDRFSIDCLTRRRKKRPSRPSHVQSAERLDFPDDPHDLIELPENSMRTEFATESRVSDSQTTNDDMSEKAAVDVPAETTNEESVEEAPPPKRAPNLPAVHSWH